MMNPSWRSARCAVTYSPSIRILGTMIHPSSDPVPIPAAKSANIGGGSRPILGTCEARKGRVGLLRAPPAATPPPLIELHSLPSRAGLQNIELAMVSQRALGRLHNLPAVSGASGRSLRSRILVSSSAWANPLLGLPNGARLFHPTTLEQSMAQEELKWQNIHADDLPAAVKKSFDAMVEAEAAFKADLEKLLKNEGHMPEDKFLVMSRK